jgi:hypothetical protein
MRWRVVRLRLQRTTACQFIGVSSVLSRRLNSKVYIFIILLIFRYLFVSPVFSRVEDRRNSASFDVWLEFLYIENDENNSYS